MESKKPENVVFILNKNRESVGIMSTYVGLCVAGFGLGTAMGARTGAFLGGTIGFTTVALTPAAAGYWATKVIKTLLKK